MLLKATGFQQHFYCLCKNIGSLQRAYNTGEPVNLPFKRLCALQSPAAQFKPFSGFHLNRPAGAIGRNVAFLAGTSLAFFLQN